MGITELYLSLEDRTGPRATDDRAPGRLTEVKPGDASLVGGTIPFQYLSRAARSRSSRAWAS